jgi:hypothetical protein
LLLISVVNDGVACSPSCCCEVDIFREGGSEEARDDASLLSLDDELMGAKYCDEDNIDVVEVDAVVEVVAAVLGVGVGVEDMDNNEEVEC